MKKKNSTEHEMESKIIGACLGASQFRATNRCSGRCSSNLRGSSSRRGRETILDLLILLLLLSIFNNHPLIHFNISCLPSLRKIMHVRRQHDLLRPSPSGPGMGRETIPSVLGKRPPINPRQATSSIQLRDLTLLVQRQTPPLDALAVNRPRTVHAEVLITADERFSWIGEVECRSIARHEHYLFIFSLSSPLFSSLPHLRLSCTSCNSFFRASISRSSFILSLSPLELVSHQKK